MTVRTSVWIGDTKHDFSSMGYEQKRDCALKIKMQILKSQGMKPIDSWLLKNPDYAEYWEEVLN